MDTQPVKKPKNHGFKDPFELMVSEMWSRIRNSDRNIAVFAVDNKVFGVQEDGVKFNSLLRSKNASLIGIYNHSISRVDLSADISIVIDELPDKDEAIHK